MALQVSGENALIAAAAAAASAAQRISEQSATNADETPPAQTEQQLPMQKQA